MDFSVVTRLAGRVGLTLSKHAPTIMVVSGTAGMIGTAVLASRATLKLEETLAPNAKLLEDIKTAERLPDYSEKDALQDRTKVYTRIVMSVGRLYAPTIIVGGASIALILGGHGLMLKRMSTLSAAYATLQESYSKLQKVDSDSVEELEERDQVVVQNRMSPYAQYWGPGCSEWSKDPEMSMMTLQAVQNWMNDLLISRGHVFLNEVCDQLGLERTPAGQIVGWIYDSDSDAHGDNYIEFMHRAATEEVVVSNDPDHPLATAWWLDFNVDGVIYDQL